MVQLCSGSMCHHICLLRVLRTIDPCACSSKKSDIYQYIWWVSSPDVRWAGLNLVQEFCRDLGFMWHFLNWLFLFHSKEFFQLSSVDQFVFSHHSGISQKNTHALFPCQLKQSDFTFLSLRYVFVFCIFVWFEYLSTGIFLHDKLHM